jgi:predicted kinase
MKPTLYLIRGISGAGKSTFAQQLFEHGVVDRVFEADDWFYAKDGTYQFNAAELNIAHNTCQENARFCLKNGKSVAVANTSTTEKEVAIYQQIANDCSVNFVSLIIENRNDTKNVHCVPEDKLKQMKERFSVKL